MFLIFNKHINDDNTVNTIQIHNLSSFKMHASYIEGFWSK